MASDETSGLIIVIDAGFSAPLIARTGRGFQLCFESGIVSLLSSDKERKMRPSKKMGVAAFVIAAVIAVFTALSHLSCIYLGASCYKAQMAPPEIVESAINGTLLAPVGTIFIASLFLLCAAYALSRAGVIRTLPLLNLGVVTIGVLSLVRGVATVPLSVVYPDMVSTFSIAAGIVWCLTGVLFLLGHRWVAREVHGAGGTRTPT